MPSSPQSESPTPAPETWFVVKSLDDTCEIVSTLPDDFTYDHGGYWGPYPSRDGAIARRIGLIRAGKCRPI